MLTFQDCRDIIQAYLDEKNLTSNVELALFDKFQKGEFCFAFVINSAEFVKTGDVEYCLVGGGQTLVNRHTGEIISMSNMGSMDNYEKRGNPYNFLSNVLQITGAYRDGFRQDCFKYFRKMTNKSISETRDLIDTLSSGGIFNFDANGWRGREGVNKRITEFQELGFTVKRLTAFEAYPDEYKEFLDES